MKKENEEGGFMDITPEDLLNFQGSTIDDEHSCFNCKYEGNSPLQKPCYNCFEYSNWKKR